jgi:hypothetical protein
VRNRWRKRRRTKGKPVQLTADEFKREIEKHKVVTSSVSTAGRPSSSFSPACLRNHHQQCSGMAEPWTSHEDPEPCICLCHVDDEVPS